MQAVAQPEHAQQHPETGADFAAAREAVLDRFANTPMAYTVNGVTYRVSGAYEAMMLCPHLQDETISAEYLEYKFKEAAGLAIETPEEEMENPETLLGEKVDTDDADEDFTRERSKEPVVATRHEATDEKPDDKYGDDTPIATLDAGDARTESGQQAPIFAEKTTSNFVVHEDNEVSEELIIQQRPIAGPLRAVQQFEVSGDEAGTVVAADDRTEKVAIATQAVVELFGDHDRTDGEDSEAGAEEVEEKSTESTPSELPTNVYNIPSMQVIETPHEHGMQPPPSDVVDLYRAPDATVLNVVSFPKEAESKMWPEPVVNVPAEVVWPERESLSVDEASMISVALAHENNEFDGDEASEETDEYAQEEPLETAEVTTDITSNAEDQIQPFEQVIVMEQQEDEASSSISETRELVVELTGQEPETITEIESPKVYHYADETIRRIEILEQAQTAAECKEAVEGLHDELVLLLEHLGYSDAETIAERLTKQYDLATLKKYIAILLRASLLMQTKDEKPTASPAASQLPYHLYGAQAVRMVVRFVKHYYAAAA